MSAMGAHRLTPGPSHVRLAMLALLTLGSALAFLGTFISLDALPAHAAGYGSALASAGALLAGLPGSRLARGYVPGPRTCGYLAGCAVLSAGGLVTLTLRPEALDRFPELAPALLIGMAAGGSARLAMGLVLPMLPTRRAASLLGLAGASLGGGGLVASLAAWVLLSVADADFVLAIAAVTPMSLAYAALRTRALGLEHPAEPDQHGGRSDTSTPRSFVLAASLVLQTAAFGILACWLAAYLARTSGLSGAFGAGSLAVMWLGLAIGWALAVRLPLVLDDLLVLCIPAALYCAGLFALLWLPWSAAAPCGAGLAGLGIGILFPMTLRLAHWPAAIGKCRWIARSIQWSLPVALLIGWAVGVLFFAVASAALVWGVLACFLGASAAIAVVVGDYRVSGDPVVI